MNPIIKLAASALPGEKKYILFAGAGVSKDAGIPTAWDLMLKTATLLYSAENEVQDPSINIEEWFTESKYAEMSYSELIEQIYPNYPDQQSFLKSYLDNRPIGQSHRGIAELARRAIIRAIVTTNFDHCIERALEEKGLKSQVISTDEDLRNSEPLIHCKAVRVYKPHGDLGQGALKNTPKDLRKLSPLMEKELTVILSDHGTIVLGYSGQDKGIQEVIRNRDYARYPLFWVNPSPPQGDIKDILEKKGCTYIQCKGAADFIDSYIRLLERLEKMAPTTTLGPTLTDLEYAFTSSKEPLGSLYADYLQNIIVRLEETRPAFEKFSEYDEAILSQINEGNSISCSFVESAILASRHDNFDAIEALYEWFGKSLKLCDVPSGFSGTYRDTDFDGFRFLVYEMFVAFIASLMKYDRWESIGKVLDEDIFLEEGRKSGYVSFVRISSYIASLDDIRKKRLNLSRISVTADLLKDRFANSELSKLVKHQEFMEADYLLFMRTVCHAQNLQHLGDVWCPRSGVYLKGPPSYIVKAESKRFLEVLTKVVGFENTDRFVNAFKLGHNAFRTFFGVFADDPLGRYDLDKLGTRR